MVLSEGRKEKNVVGAISPRLSRSKAGISRVCRNMNSIPARAAPFFLAGVNVLLGATGSVASIRVPRLLEELKKHGANVRLVMTNAAEHFVQVEQNFPTLDADNVPDCVKIFTDKDEWDQWSSLSDPVLHIQLRKWADLLLIAPTSANTLAKLANGLSDNLLTCIARAWPLSNHALSKPLVLAPAMNTCMWDHPVTAEHLNRLRSFGIHIIPPVSKTLACGDTGIGAMESVENIVSYVITTCAQTLHKNQNDTNLQNSSR